jgi:hypothetical protein
MDPIKEWLHLPLPLPSNPPRKDGGVVEEQQSRGRRPNLGRVWLRQRRMMPSPSISSRPSLPPRPLLSDE